MALKKTQRTSITSAKKMEPKIRKGVVRGVRKETTKSQVKQLDTIKKKAPAIYSDL